MYDPQQKTLLADRGEIGVGEEYQAEVLESTIDGKGYFCGLDCLILSR